jgi:hypothetical protein
MSGFTNSRITTLPTDGFLVEDVLDLYHGRGADRGQFLLMKIGKQDPDRWCSYTECGQELWQVACQWVWNLRLSLGQTMQKGELREMEWAPPSSRFLLALRRARRPPPRIWPRALGGGVRSCNWTFRR